MKETLQKISNHFKKSFGSDPEPVDDYEEEYVELDSKTEESKAKINVRPFTLDDFSDIKPILDCLREGYTIALINIRPLKDKDLIELKRAINKLKKTCQAIEGDVAGFGEDWIVAVPSFAEIYRNQQTTKIEPE
ncbi:cell division protein SepF [Candidatus Woesearchaeota archaeon]|nr:cell division protein SepF [Candidatus Woesearchaeota archaeon]